MAASPSEIQWFATTYGPDGPWYAVSVLMGNLSVPMDLFPAHYGPSNVFDVEYCRHEQERLACIPNEGNFWSSASTGANTSLYNVGSDNWMYPISNSPAGGLVIDIQTIPAKTGLPLTSRVGVNILTGGTYTLSNSANARNYDYTLCTLSLGSLTNGIYYPDPQTLAANLTPNAFYLDRRLPSASFGMHVGSVSLNIAPSLVFGGFDKSRVLGPVISKNFNSVGQSQLQLKDISLGTSAGALPPSFQNRTRTGLLATNGTTVASAPIRQTVTVDINPGMPYLVLPASTCQLITEGLPMAFDSDFQMWLWNTDDEEFQRLVDGANYLGFTFTQLGIPDVTIRVPFQLLNLTLSSPLSSSQLQYFPCYASSNDDSVLGRAFLQAAFFGGNWMPGPPNDPVSGTWFLAQAPGPNVGPSNIAAISAQATSISASDTTWESTWFNTWHPLQKVPANTSTSRVSTSLSAGAQAGIGVGCGLAGLALLVLLVVWLHRRHQKTNNHKQVAKEKFQATDEVPAYKRFFQGYINFGRPVEAPGRLMAEAPGRPTTWPYELDADEVTDR